MRVTNTLVGRGRDLEQVRSALSSRGACLVFGPGGMGKTSLAVATCAEWERVEWVDAATLDSRGAVHAAILDRLDPMPLGDRPLHVPPVDEDHSLLVVIDGAEGLGPGLGDLLRDLTAAREGPRVLVTTRHLPVGTDLPVVRLRPLALDGDDGPSEAVVVFHDRYRAAGGTPETVSARGDAVSRLVRTTGGVPGLLALAAARAALVGFETGRGEEGTDSTEALFDLAVDRSVALLDDDAVALLLALGSSADSVPTDLALALCDLPAERVHRALEDLARHALVDAAASGVQLLPPVRRSVRRRAVRTHRAGAADRRHLQWCLALAVDPQARDPAALVGHDAEIRLAITRCLEGAAPGSDADALVLARELADAYTTVLEHRRALDLMDEVLGVVVARVGASQSDELFRLLHLAAMVGASVAGAEVAAGYLDQAQAVLHLTSARAAFEAALVATRAQLAFDRGDLAAAVTHAQVARELADQAADDGTWSHATTCLAEARYESGELAVATELAEQVVRRQAADSSWLRGRARLVQGWCALERGATAVALAIARSELERCRRTAQPDGALEAVFLLVAADPAGTRDEVAPETMAAGEPTSWIAYLQLGRCRVVHLLLDGDASQAVIRAADTAVVAAELPHRWELIEALLLLGGASLAAGDLAQAQHAFGDALADAVAGASPLRAADALDGIAALHARTGSSVAGAAAGVALAQRRALGAVARSRPWLSTRARPGAVPRGWFVGSRVTDRAVDDLRRVIASGSWADGPGPLGRLSRSELAVARLVAEGWTNREIGERLFVSRRTVETHIAHAFQKLDVRSRSQLASLVTAAGP